MPKCRGERKGIKRPPRRPQASDHDHELAELASVLSEYSLDSNAAGWFRPAWRDGWNAVELAAAACEDDGQAELAFLRGACERHLATSEVYEIAGDYWATAADKMLRTALRCLQVLIAKSDGGGEIYNAILVGPFSERLPEEVFDLVLEHRCRDSIGTTAQLQSDGVDRQRRAFTIAWKRGLYLAAYAIKPAIKTFHTKLTILKEP
jgi:hypothetical protein